MTIEDMFGDPNVIDIMAEAKTGEIVLGLVCNGFIDGDPKTQTALLDKMYPGRPVILRVIFTEKPDEIILDLLYRCQSWVNDYGAVMELVIDGKTMRFEQN